MKEFMVSITFSGKTTVKNVTANGYHEAARAMVGERDAHPVYETTTGSTARYTHERGTIRVTAL